MTFNYVTELQMFIKHVSLTFKTIGLAWHHRQTLSNLANVAPE